MWWQDSEPTSRIDSASTNSKHSESLDAIAKLVESVQTTEDSSASLKRIDSTDAPVSACVELELKTKIAELERRDREREDHHAEQLKKSLGIEKETKDQLARALAKASRLELQQKSYATDRMEAISVARFAKKDLTSSKQKYVDEIKCLQVSIAFKERKFLGIEKHYDEQFSRCRDAHNETERQYEQLVEFHTNASAKFAKKVTVLKRFVAERDSTISRLEGSLTEQAVKIAELEQNGREAEFKYAQAQSSLLDSEKQKSQLVALQAAAATELEATVAAHERSLTERDSTIIRLEVSLAKQATKIAQFEEYGREAELKYAQAQSFLLDSEKQKSQLDELHAVAATELKTKVAAHERSVAERDSTIIDLEALLAKQATKIAELEEYRRDAELRFAKSQCALLESEKHTSRLIERHEAEIDELKSLIASHDRNSTERDSTISRLEELQNALNESRRWLSESNRDYELAESRLHQCERTISQLQEQSSQLQNRLDREAASRRKTEAALKQATESAKDDSALHALGVQFANVQRIERLTNELLATRNFCLCLQQQAHKKAMQAQRGIRLSDPAPIEVPRAAS